MNNGPRRRSSAATMATTVTSIPSSQSKILMGVALPSRMRVDSFVGTDFHAFKNPIFLPQHLSARILICMSAYFALLTVPVYLRRSFGFSTGLFARLNDLEGILFLFLRDLNQNAACSEGIAFHAQ